MSLTRQIQYKVYLDDLDYMGVVNHATWVTILERNRTALFSDEFGELHGKNLYFAIASVKADYKKPARFGNLLDIEVTISSRGKSSLSAMHSVSCSGETCMEAEIILVLVDARTGKSVPLPDGVTTMLNGT